VHGALSGQAARATLTGLQHAAPKNTDYCFGRRSPRICQTGLAARRRPACLHALLVLQPEDPTVHGDLASRAGYAQTSTSEAECDGASCSLVPSSGDTTRQICQFGRSETYSPASEGSTVPRSRARFRDPCATQVTFAELVRDHYLSNLRARRRPGRGLAREEVLARRQAERRSGAGPPGFRTSTMPGIMGCGVPGR
jgi:hypothetical protein